MLSNSRSTTQAPASSESSAVSGAGYSRHQPAAKKQQGIHEVEITQIRHPFWRWLIGTMQKAHLSRLTLVLPDHRSVHIGELKEGIPAPTIRLNSTAAVRKAYISGVLGWGEAYIEGDWETDDLLQVTEWAMHNSQALDDVFEGSAFGRWLHRLLHRLNDNSLKGSRRNISAHYDLGNEFYEQWLDPSMTYSSALYQQPQESLQSAQHNKYDRILELLNIQPQDKVLEIGCGWGGFAERLLTQHENSQYHGVTLSTEQLAWAQKRLKDHAVDNRGEATLTDYRMIEGQYDKIASIEMLEAVGEAHWPTYFQTLYDRLKPGGEAVIQVITIEEDRFENYRNNADFIQRYIFPGGMLLTPRVVQEQAEMAGLELNHQQAFGQDYARTLAEWRDNFEAAWQSIQPLGFDERFRRLWRYYLCYCESGFRHESIDVYLFRLKKPE
ncbi:SAM-dependent methyltransferase [Oceanospirillum sanctuarii]|uniref:SAM-dependent methyltransferase n=1 Tax=Oceanospirillum sanctuarii TaxID=1434821 RepID=UPI000A3B187A|nr:cyclopropane-fatty-acyl-phospholipid synthase family protein [Oceanospirillum sanctuarii]